MRCSHAGPRALGSALALFLLLVALPAAEPVDAIARAKALAEFTPSFQSFVFEGETFPEVVLDRKKLEGLLGDFALKVTFYDRDSLEIKTAKQPGPYGAVVELMPKTGRTLRRFVTLYRTPPKVPATLRFEGSNEGDFGKALGIKPTVVHRQGELIAKILKGRLFSEWSHDPPAARLLAGLNRDNASSTQPLHKYDDAFALERQFWVGLKRRLNGWDKAYPKPFVCPQPLEGPSAVVVHPGTLEQAGMKHDTAEKIDAACRTFAADTDEAFAVCVVRHGVIVFHKAYGMRDGRPISVDTKSWMASVTKTMSASLMMMAVDQGLVDLDDPIEKYLPSLKGIKVARPVTIRHLYTHTSGLSDWPGWNDEMPDVEERLAAYYDQLKVGDKWGYTGTGNMLGAKMLEAFSGEALPRFYQRHLLGPLGCTGTDVAGSHADTFSTSLDMAKFGQMLLNRGSYGRWRFFRSETFEKMLPQPLTKLLGPDTKRTFGIGLDGNPRRIGHGTASAATFSVDFDNDLVVVMTRNKQGKNQDKYQGKIREAIHQGIYVPPTIVVAEGEQFQPKDDKGWKVTHQNDSYGSHTYGGMWMTHGGCLGAPADSNGSVAVQTVEVPKAGRYRVWSKYQAPPYFNYLHQVEILQKGKVVFSATYGKSGTPRLWSFSGISNELWWPWGVDHDAAEAPKNPATLDAGPAEVRLKTIANPKPAGDRFVDFVLLTTNLDDDYDGYKPYRVGTPFANEALAATRLYMRFKNTTAAAAKLTVQRGGHFQPNYGGATAHYPAKPVAAGEWSEWYNVGPFCRLVHDEGLTLTLPGAAEFPVQFARDAAGKTLVGDFTMKSGEVVVVPLEITWKKDATVRTSRAYAESLLAESKKWRTANGGKKPKEIAFFGAFSGHEKWVAELKDRLGYNTELPEGYERLKRDRVAAHFGSLDAIRKLSASLKGAERDRLRVVSFGDEIGLGKIDYKDPKNQAKFRDWLLAKGVTAADLKMPLADARLTEDGDPRLVWYANLFNEEQRFAEYRAMTELCKELFGPEVLTGANYSPHHLALCYGPIYQWVDIFKHKGMSMWWGEDYIFSVPEVPQSLSWMLAEVRCGVKYHNQLIHFYIMPHAPGQLPGFLRRNMLLAAGFGARHIDSFWVAPEERFTENYVAWSYTDTFRTIHESIYDTAEAERYLAGGKVCPARVALVIGKATDFNESRLMVDKAKDPFASRCENAPAKLNQILCRKDQQMLYLALRHAQHAVELITEDDIADGILKQFDVVYFAGEWIDTRAVTKLDAWVKAGGVLYAASGVGHLNQFNEPEPAMLRLLGLKETKLTKNAVILRTLLELPLMPAIDTFTLDGKKISAIGMRQQLTPDGAKVLGTWSDGSAAVTVHDYGKGKAFAVGTLAGNVYMKSALKPIPFAAGRHTIYNPTDFDPTATKLVRLGIDAKKPEQSVVCGNPCVEAVVMDHKEGTIVTLVNWTNAPIKGLSVTVRLPAPPGEVRSVRGQKALPVKYTDEVASFIIDLDEADYVLLPKGK